MLNRAHHGLALRDVELPPEAALPGLGVHSWQEVMEMSQKERRLVLKISGFDPTAWGSRGVYIGHDLPATEWRAQIEHALADHQHSWMMQTFREASLIEHPVYLAAIVALVGAASMVVTAVLGSPQITNSFATETAWYYLGEKVQQDRKSVV